MGNVHLLPDSRLRLKVGTVMVDWPLPGGGTVRLEAEPVYCANCGTLYAYVPLENTTFAFYVCNDCHKKLGDLPGTCAVPDDEFNAAVAEEMRARFGRPLADAEIHSLAVDHRLGPALEALERDSPYPVPTRPGG